MAFWDGVKNFFGGIGQAMTGGLGSIAQGVSSLATTGYNIFNNERQFKEQQKLNAQQVEMADTETSRSLADAHRAGLSTAQWLSMNGGQAGSPSLGTTAGPQVGAPDFQSPYLRAKEMKLAEEAHDNQMKAQNAEIERLKAETEYYKSQTTGKNIENDYKETEIHKELDYRESQIQSVYHGMEMDEADMKLRERQQAFDEYYKTVQLKNDLTAIQNNFWVASRQLDETHRHNIAEETFQNYAQQLDMADYQLKIFEKYMLYGNQTGKDQKMLGPDGKVVAVVPKGFMGLEYIDTNLKYKEAMAQVGLTEEQIKYVKEQMTTEKVDRFTGAVADVGVAFGAIIGGILGLNKLLPAKSNPIGFGS